MLIYATSPVKRIVGYFRAGSIHKGSPKKLWFQFSKRAGIGRRQYFAYFSRAKMAFAIQVASAKRFVTDIDPYTVWPDFFPPQSFRYIEKREAETLKEQGMEVQLTLNKSLKLTP